MAKDTKKKKASSSGPSLFTIAIVAMAVLGIVAIVMTSMNSRGDASAQTEVAEVEVQGDPLPAFPREGQDPAVGQKAPTLVGQTFDGSEMTVRPGTGQPMAIVFLAHWCPHCQNEVKELVPWIEGGGVPAGVELRAVSTLVQEGRGNYPPSRWLEREDWTIPTLVDNGSSAASNAYGLAGTPFWVFVDAEGNVVQRASGEIGTAGLRQVLTQLAASS